MPSIIVAGRNQDIDRTKIHEIFFGRGNKIQHLTYDEIETRIELNRSSYFGKYEDKNGYSIHLILIPKKLPNEDNFIFDVGINENSDRISIFIDKNEKLVFKIIDSNGISYYNKEKIEKLNIRYGQMAYLSFEIGLADDYSYSSIEVNGTIFSDRSLDNLSLDISDFSVVGSDLNGKAHSCFELSELISYGRTLKFEEKLNLRTYCFSKIHRHLTERRNTALFEYNKFMYSKNHPNFNN